MSVTISQAERLIGRDVQPRVGMTVKLTEQALERRSETQRADPSKGGTGVIVKVHPNWTCDVMWHNTKKVRIGYACGTAAGKVSRLSDSLDLSVGRSEPFT
uniref:Uncharacterized protein n=1 Tax=Guillardia theta TaxID=55529 RepID=A0A7S4L9H5_GUITH|mmetsp:Transcript_40341/g.126956  ORF Transcript_40341/g.126956 Transcript_40341/m.126956 type:complete len:101 (+) Transcript_40341:124-426(+)